MNVGCMARLETETMIIVLVLRCPGAKNTIRSNVYIFVPYLDNFVMKPPILLTFNNNVESNIYDF